MTRHTSHPHRAQRGRIFSWLTGAAVFALILSLAVPAAAQEGLWFHVKVLEEGNENTKVTVNLPVALIQNLMPVIAQHADGMEDGRIQFDDSDVTIADLRQVVDELRNAPDATFAEVESEDEKVVFYKQGRYLRAKTTEGGPDGAMVDARIPIAVLDALLSGGENELDLQAAIAALAAHGPGDLVQVRDGATSIRVWIDDQAEAR